MPFFDIPLPAPFRSLTVGKPSKGTAETSVREQASSKISWTKLGRSFGRRKLLYEKRRHSIQEFGQCSWTCQTDTLPPLPEKEDTGAESASMHPAKDDSVVPMPALCQVFSHLSSEGSDSDGPATPVNTLSRAPSYKNDYAFYGDKSTSKKLTSGQWFDFSVTASEPDLSDIATRLVEKTQVALDDDLEYLEKMLNGPHVFIPSTPYIHDGPMPVTRVTSL
ncbi:hypothetical protein BD309DRAFT_206579 [Dichomitus squalens]|uniref:Uncharacterized protein n=2 Tax=Dichomitus squalens TaxID=114155 RepID=A0A4Q9PH83_9APHY|nr:uncharacterized protein DICSQDRAFT_137082 [Dichomitus squalens LYAD-421 SS1]EJF60860.1 hypothetical protein DICSQDRAFT_137082 [Dichomitus squalens LYAD-421 SS1]TBU42177.1 hypothetical protein BD309DRAFT_206579 [Dichomitus squalens]TBU52957.1 hypothetical protein BD310DRAFT_981467 [Dichomitus squalens]